MSQNPKSKFTEGQELWVRPTYVTDPHDFYVRRLTDDEWIQTFQDLNAVEQQPAFTSAVPPAVGALVLFNHPSLSWARGKVYKIKNNGKCRTFLFDYGESVLVAPSSLHPLIWGDTRLPMALHCRLNFCAPLDGKTWSAESIATFRDYLGSKESKITVMRTLPSGQLEVEVQNELPDTVSMLLVVAEKARLISSEQDVNRLQPDVPGLVRRHYYLCDYLSAGEETKVRVIFVSEQIAQVVKEERYAEYSQMSDKIKDVFSICAKIENEDLVQNTPVLWKEQKNKSHTVYWRGLVLEDAFECDTVVVTLADQGRDVRAHARDLREPPTSLLEPLALALCCRLTQQQARNKAVSALLVPGVSLTVRTEQVETDIEPYIITIVQENSV